MSVATTGDFFAADEGRKPTVLQRPIAYAPGDEPNPRNPGGISNNALKRQQQAAQAKVNLAETARLKKAADEKRAAQLVREQKEALAAANKRSGGLVGDLKAIGKGVATATATVAKIAGTVAAVVPGGQIIGGALIAGGAALSAASKGDLKGALVAGASVAAPAFAPGLKALVPTEIVTAVQTTVATVQTAAATPIGKVIAATGVLDTLAKGANISAAALVPSLNVSSLVYDAANLDGLRVIADKLIAASKQGGAVGAQALQILATTKQLANATGIDGKVRASALASLALLGEVAAARAREKIADGAERAVTAAGAKAAAQYVAASLGVVVALPAGVTARAEQAPGAFAGVRSAAPVLVKRPAASSPFITGMAPPPAVPVPSAMSGTDRDSTGTIGFVVTDGARILDGTRWREDPAGVAGVVVRATGPIALREDATSRRWKRV